MKLIIPTLLFPGLSVQKLAKSHNVQVHVLRARARYCYRFALVKKKITKECDLAVRDAISSRYIRHKDRLSLLRL
jgi:hypothetical protein